MDFDHGAEFGDTGHRNVTYMATTTRITSEK